MQFIHLRPAVVLIGQNGEVHEIRRMENLADMENPESVPAHLAG
jgi:diaminopimelate decarboxylase